MSVRHRRPLLASTVLVLGAGLALTACGPDNTDTAGGPAASATTAAAKPSTAGAPATAGAPTKGATSHPSTHAPSGGSTGAGAGHPCDIQNLSIHVTARSEAPSQRVIEVQNTGANSCTLSSSPGVDLGNSTAQDQSKNIKPVLASGTSRFTVPAGQKAYAVIDLDPSGATTGTAPGVNELNVLADDEGTDMPLSSTQNFPLGDGARVLDPKMSIYRASVAEAVKSMAAAPN
ncbi:DUF4232 domain-containing protein [Kitasatospora aureofaciens]|uniref:DUF4232 domain-containing protein n=1 Tax=Kitasatospora aureofaciens TaxID=1894 RepID=UPI0005275D1E|nr:DUF4232 domain-containing protein [Kitasatospora aureofaciens]